MKEYWRTFIEFLKKYDMTTLAQTLQEVDWTGIYRHPVFWIGITLFLGWVVWKKAFRSLLLALSLVAFVVLLNYTLPPAGETLTFEKLLPFAGGCLGLLAINVYFFVIRN